MVILFLFQSLESSRWEIKANRNRAFRVFIRDEDVQRLVKWAGTLDTWRCEWGVVEDTLEVGILLDAR